MLLLTGSLTLDNFARYIFRRTYMCDCETAGGEFSEGQLLPMAWEVDGELIDDKSLYILRLIGIHLLSLPEDTKDKLIDVLKDSLGIKDFKELGKLYVVEFATGDKYTVCKVVYHENKLAFQDVNTGGIVSDPYVGFQEIKC